MDVLDLAHGHFIYRHFLDDRRDACMGAYIADCGTSRFFKDPDDTRDTVLFRLIRERIYPYCLDGIHRLDVVDRASYFRLLGYYCYALGVNEKAKQVYLVYVVEWYGPSRRRRRPRKQKTNH